MSPKLKYALALAASFLLLVGLGVAAGLAVWADLSPQEQAALAPVLIERTGLLGVFALILLLILGVVLRWLFNAYPAAAARLEEGVRIAHTVNPDYRLEPAGSEEMRRLAEAINAFAQARSELLEDVEAKIAESNARLEEEKNRLAALMSELTQSVLVCNSEGRILLYNARAKHLLEQVGAAGAPVGLGRSIFAILDRNLIVHALDSIRYRLEKQGGSPGSHFVTAHAGQLLRAHMAPVLGAQRTITGFVLTLEDITRSVEINTRRDFLLQSLTEGTRASLANIRAAVETMLDYPQMEPERRARFTQVIRDEAENLSERLERTVAEHADSLKAQWPLEDMMGADLVSALRRSVQGRLGVKVQFAGGDDPVWLSVDSFSVVQALAYIVSRLKDEFGVDEIGLDLAPEGRFVRLELAWRGPPVDTAALHAWEDTPLAVGGEGSPLTLKDVLDRHGGEAWCRPVRATGENRLCLQLPAARPEIPAPVAPSIESRPEYYDFDLFNQPGQSPELDERPLTDLSYTVFDTETTGLSPSEGDEIIAIGAVRIVNGRLLKHECFEQLVDPKRPIAPESQQIHGISPEMLEGQPSIETVLPAFHRFAEDTVLVAHNAAFDMRFLQMKEAQTGVCFIQPVLDTLLLSAVAHPGYPGPEHALEAVAARLGINVIGRHTALGDAIVTGEVFLKLIPLLAQQGIHTLRQAREASQKTLYAKIQY